MSCFQISQFAAEDRVIPAARNIADFKYALEKAVSPGIILLFGDVNTLPGLLQQAQHARKRLLVHLDLLEGIGKDKAGISYLARLGVHNIITTKSQLCKIAREEGMMVVQRAFLMDSEAIRTCLQMVRSGKPDAIEILPATVPAWAVQQLKEETGLPIIAGGLLRSQEEVVAALQNGLCAVSTGKKDLWRCR